MTQGKNGKIACIGIGGAGVYYVAKYFLRLGLEVYGYDMKESARTKELQQLGARVTLANPKGKLEEETTFFVYSPGLPAAILQTITDSNSTIQHTDVGTFTSELTHKFEWNLLEENEKNAFIESEIAPLYTLDQSKMTYLAVTGTDGKTTTCTMIFHLLKKLGYKPGLISTVSAKIGDQDMDTGFHTTTPSPQELYKFLKLMESEGCTHAIIESTSHGLAMGRLAGLKFVGIAYTNITSEHLDYHKTWENYYLAKETLLTEHTRSDTCVVINKDDVKSYTRLQSTAMKLNRNIATYSLNHGSNADLTAAKISELPTISFELNSTRVEIPIIGRYNISNALAAIGVVSNILNLTPEEVGQNLNDFQTVTGRMQILRQKPFTVIVDFAHTANALEEALTTLRRSLQEGNRLIVVFGCAGQRDATKREPMGTAAGRLADITVLTAEDPRAEKLIDINNSIEAGWKTTADASKELYRFDDESLLTGVRQQAIEKALSLAKTGDVVLIAGKAHEQSLCFGATEYPWSDIEITKELLDAERST